MISRCLNFVSFARFISFSLIVALMSPMLLVGQVTVASTFTYPPPASLMPKVEFAPPLPFRVRSEELGVSSSSLIFGVSGWDYLASWFGDSATSINSENSANSATFATIPASTPDLSRARLSPKNQTGGTSLYSRNFGWGTGLAGLSGRGLDAGFGIAYNSLNWIRVGNEMIFNPNNDNVTPGFRFGFPVIEPQYLDSLTNKNTFLMITPSGSRVEFRQVATDTFETADSSYVQLKVVDSNNLTLTGTDGTNAYYQLKNGAFRCSQIKDANGNFITINHDNNGLLQSVTDTLGRVLTVNYDNQGSPISVTQARSSGTFTFASLSYTNLTISTNFSGLNLVGITNGATIKVLNQITYADGSHTNFDYNSYGQVWKVSNYAADNHLLNYSATNLQTISGAQTDVPRFSELRNWTENFNLNTSNVAQEVVIPIVYQENASFTLPGGSGATGTLLQVSAPDGTISKTFVGNAGWMEAIPVLTEDWANGERKRWSYTAYTQDDPNLSYVLNPRATESMIGDSANNRRTTMEYWTQNANPNASLFGLVKEVKVYDSNQTTVLKRSTTDYNLSNDYLNRRIIGLPSKSELFDQANALMAKVTYAYDEGNFSESGQNITPINHDSTNYGAGFIVGRGNATSSSKWDVTDANNASKAITSRVKYNITGNPVASLDPLNREVKTSYTDSFDDNQNRNTFAYPTQITDPANNSSTVKYRFETGANMYAQSPAPAGQSEGKKTQRFYDTLGRLEKEIVLNTGAYTRYEYPTNGIQSKVFSTITDTNNNGADTADEVLSESFSDGAGRTRMARSEHPNSAGGFSGTLAEYDIMGRVKRSTVPTEINNSWQPSGDDATRGWLWSSQEYDWKGRTIRQINTDGTDKLISYEGCGCAGGQVTTVSGEQLAEGRRRQKVYEDILGRTFKSETLNWDGSIYSTSKSFFNGRDQVTLARQFAGTENSSTFQDTTATFDGYGRLKTQHRPEQDANTATTYNYFADDSVQNMIDARGAMTSYAYDNRRLVTQVSYSGSGIAPTPNVTFNYDNLGNRTLMTDGYGNVTYEYNQLSQLTAETRQFTDSLPNAPLSNNRFKIQYSYSFSGQLNSITDPYNQQINYAFDKVGRLNSVTGSSFGNITTYASNSQYRAWGAMKHLEYGSNHQINLAFNNRLQAASYNLSSGGGSAVNNYQYYADGKLKYVQNVGDGRFDRLNIYDHLGRIKEAKSGGEARGETVNNLPFNLPYRQSYQYNAFDNMTQRNNLHWGTEVWLGVPNNHSYNYQNNRIIASGSNQIYQYDADGRMLMGAQPGDAGVYGYDVRGLLIDSADNSSYPITTSQRIYDGNGREIKRTSETQTRPTEENPYGQISNYTGYYIRSTVMGNETLTEVDSTGKKLKTFVNASGMKLATQYVIRENGSPFETVSFAHTDASGMNFIATGYTSGENEPAILDPLGSNVGVSTPYIEENNPPPVNKDLQPQSLLGDSPMIINGQKATITLDGLPISYAALMSMSGNSLAVEVRNGTQITQLPVEKMNGTFMVATADEYSVHYRRLDAPGIQFGLTFQYMGPTGWMPINFGQRQQTSTRPRIVPNKPITSKMNDSMVWKIRNELTKILTPECLNTIKKLFAEASRLTQGTSQADTAVSDDPLELFDGVWDQGGFYFGIQNLKNSVVGYSTGNGAIGSKNAKIIIGYGEGKKSIHQLATDVLAEIYHVAGSKPSYYNTGTFSDYNLAVASHNLNLAMPRRERIYQGLANFSEAQRGLYYLTNNTFPLNLNPGQDFDNFRLFSSYFHSAIKRHCK